MTHCQHCGKTWGGHRPEHCTVCHETFTGNEAGDRHRVGDHNDRDPNSPDRRRCLTSAEMLGAGMVQDDRGMWRVHRDRPNHWAVARQTAEQAESA